MNGIPLVFDVYRVQVQFRYSRDLRPAVVVGIKEGPRYACAVISGQMDLFDERTDFLIEQSAPSFRSTGLIRTSYVTSKFVFDLDPPDLLRRLGSLSGDVLTQFEAWWRRRA